MRHVENYDLRYEIHSKQTTKNESVDETESLIFVLSQWELIARLELRKLSVRGNPEKQNDENTKSQDVI